MKGARRGKTLLLLGLTWLGLLGAAQAAEAANLLYHGGPVARSMTGVVVDWGAGVNSLYTNETTGDPGFLKYLSGASGSTGGIGGVLAQYMDSTGHNAANVVSYGQQYPITPSAPNSTTTVYDSQIQSELASQIQAGHLPHPAGNGLQTIYLVLFPSGITQCIDSLTCSANAPDPATQVFCAYHGNTTLSDSTNVLYAVLPDNTTGLMSTACGTASTLGNQTSFLSHEWYETATDPFGTTWYDTNGNEVGDLCNQFMDTQGGWTIQREWSNVDRNCAGSESAYSAPTASFLAPSAAAPSQPVGFDASSSADPSANSAAITGTSYSISSGISSYQWTWGDGTSSTTSTTPTATHAYASLGNYQVSLAITDKLGFTSTVTHQVAITTSGSLPPIPATGAAGGISDTGATVNGTVSPEGQAVQYHFVYGTSPGSLTQSTPLTPGPTGQVAAAVSATLSGLSASTPYYYRIDVVTGGQTYSGAVQSFSTNATPAPAQTPVIATGSASQVTTKSAVLGGTVNPGGSQAVSYDFAYGTSATGLDATTPQASGPAGTTGAPVSATVSGLNARTTYYYRLDVSLAGRTYSGVVQSFTTLTPGPSASTGPAIRVTSSSATISGAVAPNGVQTSYHVEFGTATAYGHSSPSFSAGAGTANVPVTVTLSGLQPRTAYHYRLVASSAGGTAVGADRALTTARAPSRPPRFTFHVRSRAALAAALHGQLKVHFSCSESCSAHFAVTTAKVGITRFSPVATTLARAYGQAHSGGSGTATVTFISGALNRLAVHRSVNLLVYGYAVSSGSAPTAPTIAPLTLTP